MSELRTFRWEDLEAVVELLQACEVEDRNGSVPTIDYMRHQLSFPGFDATRIVHVLPNATDGLDACCIGVPLPGPAGVSYLMDLNIRPERRQAALEDELLHFMEAQAADWCRREGTTATLQAGVPSHQAHRLEFYARHGYQPQRWFLELERDLTQPIPDLPDPDNLVIRSLQPATDAVAVYTAFWEAFQDHWNPPNLTLEQFTHMTQGPHFRPELNLLALTTNGEPAGLCLCSIRDDYNQQNNTTEGSVDILGVRRPFRRAGLGRALVARGLHALHAAGMTATIIGVDADNPTGATRLYASIGFTERKRSVALRKPIA
jgi:mycothiol synthase